MSQTVLIVEDDPANMKLFNDVLEEQGYRILKAHDGVGGLKMVKEHLPDLVLMDIMIPAPNGLEVTKWLKADETLRHIPVVAVTARAMKGDRERMLDGGCDGYVPKPIKVKSFIETVREYLAASDRRFGPETCSGCER